MNAHFRLEEERKRIKIDREQMAAAGGVALRTYANYVTGHRAPDSSFLSGIAAAGADVLYILTGRREARAEAVADVARADYAVARPVVEAWDKLTVAQQALILALMHQLAGRETAPAPATARSGPQRLGLPITKDRRRHG